MAVLHMLIPSHWLCFVIVGRAHGWKPRKTLTVAATAGLLHVLSTVGLGVAVLTIGSHLLGKREMLEHVGALVLIGLGILYLGSHLLGTGHRHEHDRSVSERVAFVALLLSLVLSPCSAAIPFLVAMAGDTMLIILIGGVLLVTTVGGMLLLVGLTLLGIEKLQLKSFDRYEKLIVGLSLCFLGTLVLILHR